MGGGIVTSNRAIPAFANHLVIVDQHGAHRDFTLFPGTFGKLERMAHPVFMIEFKVGQRSILQSEKRAHYTHPLCIITHSFQLLKFAKGRDAPAVLAEIKEGVVLLTVAVAAVEPQRGANFLLQLHHLFVAEAAHGQHPATVRAPPSEWQSG
ncbi:Uncharacterised protein [Leclercia adecarboxylata]|uniref:Uncharacterized protein n=1 Tax=Leclercia adecarboxylata TaxID=83655 RepID=A0A4U9IDC9_9ENTR|nr:Uncharacterised protein [Leclercia adecarboxylata]